METDFGDNYTQATPENDNTGTYQDNSDSYTRDNEVDQLNSDFANFQQDFSRNSPKDTGIFGGGGAGDFGFGLNRNAGKGIEGIDPTYQSNFQSKNLLNQQMVDYYTKARGATATNPFPESFFSQLVGIENVNYAKSMGKARVQELNELRARQAFNLPTLSSMKRAEAMDDPSQLKEYGSGDYYIGQNTNMGEVKPVPSTTRDIINFMPGGGILNALTGQPGLPENDPRYQEIMNERAKSANDPTVFDRVSDYVKEVTGFGPKDKGNSLSIPVQGQEKQTEIGINPFAPQEKFAEFSGIQSMINKQNTNPISVPASVDIQQIVNNPLGRQDPYGYTMVNTPYTSTGTKLSPLLP